MKRDTDEKSWVSDYDARFQQLVQNVGDGDNTTAITELNSYVVNTKREIQDAYDLGKYTSDQYRSLVAMTDSWEYSSRALCRTIHV